MLPHNWIGGRKSFDFVFGGILKFYDRYVKIFCTHHSVILNLFVVLMLILLHFTFSAATTAE